MKGKKLAVGAALVAVPSLALAAPAAADRSNVDSAEADINFTYEGTPVVCTLVGIGSYIWDEETDRTSVTGSTEFRGATGSSSANQTRCREIAVLSVTATVHWLDEDNQIHGTEGNAVLSDFVQTKGFGPGNVNEVNSNHTAEFFCDGPDGLTVCSRSVATSPSTK
jgi:hypothetical protein